MTTKSKRLIFAGATIMVVGIILFFIFSRDRGYRAISLVKAKSLTSSLYSPAFEQEVIKTMPGVLSVLVKQRYLTANRGPFHLPHGDKIQDFKAIYIIAEGPTAETACRAANEAATTICQKTLTNYAATGTVFSPATIARPYSFFHDVIGPAIQSPFNRIKAAL